MQDSPPRMSPPETAFELTRDEPLSRHCSLELGGTARWFARVRTEAEVLAALEFADTHGHELLALGGGSNCVFADTGHAGLVLQLALSGMEFTPDGDRVHVRAAAGESWDALVARCCAEELQGLECLSGIPGTVGASPIQNIGAYGQEVAEVITSVRYIDRAQRRAHTISGAECEFAYRQSRFKGRDAGRCVVTSVTFTLRRNAPPTLRYPALRDALTARNLAAPSLAQVRQTVLDVRRSKSMLLTPTDPNRRNCGSFFLNPIVTEAAFEALCARCSAAPPRFPAHPGWVKVPAAWLIEQAGFARGQRRGAVGISTEHTLCLVAHTGATSRELVAWARHIRDQVEERLGIELTPEPQLIGLDW